MPTAEAPVLDEKYTSTPEMSGDFLRNNQTDHYAHDARNFEEITLKNGERIDIARPSASDLEDPLHMAITGTPEQTPGWYRLMMAGAMSRHLFRAVAEGFTGFDGAKEFLDNDFINKSGIGYLINKIVPERDKQLESVQSFFQTAADSNIAHGDLAKQEGYKNIFGVFQSAGKVHETDGLIADVYDGFKKSIGLGKDNFVEGMFGAAEQQYDANANVTFEDFAKYSKEMSDVRDGRNFYKAEIGSVKSELSKNQFGHIFDAGLAAITTFVTVKYAKDVYRDMHRSFAETIAYEKYDERKKPSEINAFDIFSSDNKIVKETCDNYLQKNAVRGLVCLAFMGRFAAPMAEKMLGEGKGQWLSHVPFGDAMLGVVGVLMLGEVMRKDSSIFNDVVDLVDNKLNPQRGMGAPINASDLFDLYQKYSLNKDSSKMFKDATRSDHNDEERWTSARVIFDRMAEMMNHTYKYKDPNFIQDDPVLQIEQEITGRLEYFTLPKYLYLLGHDMIDFDNPELTLACAEISNTYSIQAAKQFWQKVDVEKTPIDVALGHYAVDLRKTLGSTSEEIDVISDRSPLYRGAILENFLDKNPEINAKYKQLVELRDAMNDQGRTNELSSQAKVIISEIRILLDKNQDKFGGYDSSKNHDYGHEKAQKDVELSNIIPNNSTNNIVKFGRMSSPNEIGVNI